MMAKIIICTVVYLSLCVIVKSSGVNLAFRKRVTRSNAVFSAAYVVDGDVRTDYRECQCCFWSYKRDSWLTVDLGQTYHVSGVIIYGATGYLAESLNGVKIYLHNEEHTKGTHYIMIDKSPRLFFFNLTLDHPVSAKYITLTLERIAMLQLCEIEVFKRVSHVCPPGVYGRSCNITCGSCVDRVPCDSETGQCTACAPGYTGDLCNKACNHGQFGPFCTGICRCKDNATCHHVTGKCPESRCIFGWTGDNCNITLNRALGKDVTVKQQYSDWPPEHAVDGVYSNHSKDYCARAMVWIRVDLGTLYAVSTITVYGGLVGEKIHIHLHTEEQDYGSTTLTIPTDTVFYSHTFVSPVLARYVTLERFTIQPFVICEIQVYGDCPDGNYGSLCNGACSMNCNGSCDKVSGRCTHGCNAGWKGEYCDQECATPSFGQNCSYTCHCMNYSGCDIINGKCESEMCNPGWQGPSCDKECPDGTYGRFCKSNCSRNCNGNCDKVSGQCTHGCVAGWQGNKCSKDCPDGNYGSLCNGTCSMNCDGNCDKVSGRCTHGCSAGWQGDKCDRAKPIPGDTVYIASIIAGTVFAVVVVVVVVVYVIRKRARCMRTENNEDQKQDVTELVR